MIQWFVNLTPGDYIISFFADDYIVEWYDDVLDPALATVITVTEEGTVTGIDAALEFGGPRIVGYVYDELTGLPVPGVSAGADGPTPDGEVSYADGRFEFRNLTPGDYAVGFFSDDHFMEWYDDAYTSGAATTVTLGAGTTVMPDVYLRPLGVYGHVVNERTGEPIVGATVTVASPIPRSGITLRDGSFAVTGFGWLDWGSYAVFVSAPGFMSEWYDDTRARRRAALVDIRPQAMPNDLHVALRPFRGTPGRGPRR
ncbi:MAG: carboxypeptidase-like regulatory domain-containing protein [Actinobacteria bacterium]|nr:carboxypeptidase-like regulatory domain-containing protein [Actinomycetota bacterium]